MHLSQRVTQMEEAATLRMSQLARELREQGKDVINLTVGEPDFDTPQHIKDAATKALDEAYTKYTPVPGLQVLREAVCNKFKRDNGLDYQPDNIVVSTGAKQGITNTILALVDPGDEVIFLSPYWVSYTGMVQLAEGTPVMVEAGVEQDFKVSAEQLEAAISDKTRLIILNTPGNPSGSVYSEQELTELAGVIKRHEGVFVISDEIYEYITFGKPHVSLASLPGMMERTITVNGMSKGFAMTGWRIGYLGAPAWLARGIAKLQGQFTSGANAFAQRATADALNGSLDATVHMRDTYEHRKKLVRDLLLEIPGLKVNDPEGAFYIFPDAGEYMTNDRVSGSAELCEYLLAEALVATVPGVAFGNDRCFRISFAASDEELTEGVRRIDAALQALKP